MALASGRAPVGASDPTTSLLSLLPAVLAQRIATGAGRLPAPLEEIRLRQERPVCLVHAAGDAFLDQEGQPHSDPLRGQPLDEGTLQRCFQLLAQGSVYAWEEELAHGFITVRGGHRVGVCGRAVLQAGRVVGVRPVTALNLRLAREVPGLAAGLLPHLSQGGALRSALLIAPPRCGKTTVLRDLVRLASTGAPAHGLPGHKVAVVDERSEIAGCVAGVPTHGLGPRTDVLDACPKAEGMMLLVRAMSPQVLAVDEIGSAADAAAVLEACHAGVTVLATAHASSLAEARQRPALAELLRQGAFSRAVVLGRSLGLVTVEGLVDAATGTAVLQRPVRLTGGGAR